jgi:FkbM family methyltransferase
MVHRLRSLVGGVRDTLTFSNAFLLLIQRLFYRRLPLVVYEWKRQWSLACDPRANDHAGVKEVLVCRDYDPFIVKSIQNGTLTYINIGANVGAFDIAAASLVPLGTSGISIELNPNTCARLTLNLAMNGLGNSVRAINAAVGGSSGVVRFSPSVSSVEDSLFARGKDGSVSVEVRMLTLEEIFNAYCERDKFFDLLKMDCEGAEYEIVAATPVGILRRFAAVVMELHPPPVGDTVQHLMDKMRAAGFRKEQVRATKSNAELSHWTLLSTRSA